MTSPSIPAWSRFLDPYDWRARALPAILCLLPPLVILVIVYPASATWHRAGLALLVSGGFFFVLTRVARDAGKRLQVNLFEAWGGAPTTQLLRHRDGTIDPHTKQGLHRRLALLTGLSFPSTEVELAQPETADAVYRAAAVWLIKRTRDTKQFALLFKENIHFGYQRNALGLRWVGFAIALASALWVLAATGVFVSRPPYFAFDALQSLPIEMLVAILFSLLMAGVWLFFITPGACKRTGFAYAERLLESAEVLTPESPTG